MAYALGKNTELPIQCVIDKRVLIIEGHWSDQVHMQKILKEIGYDQVYFSGHCTPVVETPLSLKQHLKVLKLHLPDDKGIVSYKIIKVGESNETKLVITSVVNYSSLVETLEQVTSQMDISEEFIESSVDYLHLLE